MKEDSVDDRWKKIVEAKACFSCLGRSHRKINCKSRRFCGVDGCRRRHHFLLHKTTLAENRSTVEIKDDVSEDKNAPVLTVNMGTSKVLLRIAPIKLYGKNGCVETFALFDEGSTVSLINDNMAAMLGVEGEIQPFCMQWANEIVQSNEDSRCIDLKISGIQNDAKMYKMKNVRTVKNLALPSQTVLMSDFHENHLQGLPIRDMRNAKPTLLIGQDNIHLTVARKVFQGPITSPVATKTHLGWVLHGNVGQISDVGNRFTFHVCCQENENENLHRLIMDSFSTETFGVTMTNARINKEELRALEILENTTTKLKNERRYETGLLWKKDVIVLPESRTNALRRLLCVERKMAKEKSYFDQYCNKIQDYLRKDYIRRLDPSEVSTDNDSRVWYLPHFGVVNPNKPNKLRLVFDAAAKSGGTSLNDNLLQGPDYLSSLPGVLMRFRRWKWGFCGDISEMFHQVQIRPEDRCAQRFLWRNGDSNRHLDEYEMKVMIFGATCSPCSAQFIKNLNARESTEYSHLAFDVKNQFYVDDYLDSTTNEETAIKKIGDMIELHREGGFEIVGWISNSRKVTEKYAETKAVAKDLNKSVANRVLGIWWDVIEDEFTFNISFHKVKTEIVSGMKTPTKREALKMVMSVFDPLGFLTNLTIRGRIILQEIWRSGISWDDAIPERIFQKWIIWLNELKEIRNVRIPRCYSHILPEASSIEIHVFCDASEEAFSAAAYLRIISEAGIHVVLVSARARVAPLRPISIPRLELQAAVMGSRLLNTVKNEIHLNIRNSYLWTDSKIVLYWIRGDGRNYKQFVAHRVGEIQELTSFDSWKYVPTNENVADGVTRFSCQSDLCANSQWFNGPSFLRNTENCWPKQDFPQSFSEEDSEEKINPVFFTLAVDKDSGVPDVNRFSKWRRFVRATAWVNRFCKRLKKENCMTDLTVEELNLAEESCLRASQNESFGYEIALLKLNKPLESNSRILQFSPFIDEHGLLRMRERINSCEFVDDNVKTPIILDPKSRLTKLLIQYYHEKRHHQGVETVLNDLRQRFWIIKGRSAVKTIFQNCQFCRIRKTKPVSPEMGQLPPARLATNVKPFTFTGIDYFGPLYVSVGRRREKRCGVLFTCMSIRAIHLEIAHSLSADGTIMAIQRMIARRGPIKAIYTDNGTNFKGASEELKTYFKSFNPEQMICKLAEQQVEWHFIPPSSPNMGGSWERLVGSVKRVLFNILKEEAPRDEVLLTVFAEIENVVNSRPLTHVSLDPNDPECLTPNHLLIGIPGGPSSPRDDVNLRKQWRRSQRIANIFWERWLKEYLPTLTKRGKWTKTTEPIKLGDIVVVVDQNQPRNSWPLGKIVATFPGKDGVTRVVEVKTPRGTYRRPVNKLCKLDVEGENL